MKIPNSKFQIPNSNRGFTLIELIVVIAIIGVLIAVALVNFGKNTNQDVRLEEDRFITFVRNVQNKSLTGEKDQNYPDRHICGWGIHRVSDADFAVFYSFETEAQYINSVSCEDSAISKTYVDASSTPLYETYKMGREVRVIITDGSQGDVFFLVPQGKVYYNGSLNPGDWPADSKIYTLEKGSGASYSSSTVTIRPEGIVE